MFKVALYEEAEKSGLDLLRAIRKERGDEVPFIILTGKGREEVAMRALNLGANYYLQKGSDIESQYGILANTIKQEVKRRATAEILTFTQHSIDTASVEIYWLDPEGEVIYSNEAASENSGYGSQELKELKAEEIFLYAQKGTRGELWKRLKEKGIETLESMNIRKDGTTYSVEVTRQYLEFKGEEYELVFALDITKRKRAEKELISTERLYQYLFNGIPDAIILHDLSANILAVNSEVVDRSGYSEQELLSMKVHDLIDADESVIDDRMRVLLEQSSLSYETVHLTRDGERIPVEESGRVIVHEDEPAILITSRDITEREKTERELRGSRERYREMVEESDQIFMVVDPRGEIQFMNDRGLDLLGYKQKGLRGRHLATNILDEGSGDAEAHFALEDILDSPEKYEECALDHIGKKGHITKIDWRFKVQRDSTGEVKELIAIGDGVNGTEPDMSDLAEVYEAIFENRGMATAILSKDMALSMANGAFRELCGFNKDELGGQRNWKEFVYDWERMREYLDGVRSGQEDVPEGFSFTLVDSSGGKAEISMTAEPISGDKLAIFLTESTHEEDNKRDVERTTREREEILDTIDTQIWYASDPGRYGFANQARADLLGVKKRDLIGKKIKEVVMDADCTECIEGNRKAFNGELVKQEEWVKNADGELRCCLVTKIPHRDKEGNIDYIVCTAHDITERKKMEEELRLANRKLNIMGSVTRHDVMNQASIIMGYQDLVKGNIDNEKLLKYLDKIENSVKKIQKQLTFEKEYEKIGEEISWIDISEILRKERGEIEAHGLLLNTEIDSLQVLADSLLEKAITNIIQNSIEHSKGNEIRVHRSESGEGLNLIIEDDGIGVPSGEKEKIFQRGYGDGFGYGLHMVREILDVSGMDIEEAGRNGAQLILFAETFIPGFPYWRGIQPISRWSELMVEYQKNSLEIPSSDTEVLADASKDAGIISVIGCTEMSDRKGSETLYNTLLFIDNRGEILGRHRKLMPTHAERMIWGWGNTEDVTVFDTDIGTVGGLVCYEHHMSLLRAAMGELGEEIHCAVWPGWWVMERHPGDKKRYLEGDDPHLCDIEHAVREYAFENQTFIISVGQYIPDEQMSEECRDFNVAAGGSMIVNPAGVILEGPVFNEEEILYATLDADDRRHTKAYFDALGHYSRDDVFDLKVKREQESVIKEEKHEGDNEEAGVVEED